jgi:hypothetical protein
MACKHDLEGIVAKHKYSPYLKKSCRMAQDLQSGLFAMGWTGRVVRARTRDAS